MADLTFAGGRPEPVLAKFAEYQGPKICCGEYSVAASLSMLQDQPQWLAGQDVVTIANRWTVWDTLRAMGPLGPFGGKSLRMWPDGPTTPWQIANLARRMAQRRNLKIQATTRSGRPGMRDELRGWLERPDCAIVVTIAWDEHTQAEIEYPTGTRTLLHNASAIVYGDLMVDWMYTAHIMVLVAYDEVQKRWGFINSWVKGQDATQLYWMTEEDFEKTWGFSNVFFKPFMWVTIRSLYG